MNRFTSPSYLYHVINTKLQNYHGKQLFHHTSDEFLRILKLWYIIQRWLEFSNFNFIDRPKFPICRFTHLLDTLICNIQKWLNYELCGKQLLLFSNRILYLWELLSPGDHDWEQNTGYLPQEFLIVFNRQTVSWYQQCIPKTLAYIW